ncbi:MAG: hypothetical protein GQ533_13555 [Methanosarcinaceae archaeon]|nr:hypothetical protein [Methanosarcinaceae archaeon]
MSKLPLVSSEKIVKRLLKAGFDYAPIKGKGSHTALVREDDHGDKFLVIIPKRDLYQKALLFQ